MEAALHPDCEALAFLLGTWRGSGKGEYPTVAPFSYTEEVRVWHVGKPFLVYAQATRAADDGRPLHAETGYLRPRQGGSVELVLAHPTGVAEVSEGTLVGTRLEFASTVVARTPSAKAVHAITRVVEVEGDELRYTLAMAHGETPLTHHLAATLHRA